MEIGSTGSSNTEKLGEKLGSNLRGGEVIELISDLGGGKTTFVRGLAKGFGSDDKVASPSFTIKREYYAGDKTLHHFDFYRLLEAGLIKHDLEETLGSDKDVVVVEWGDIVHDVLPAKRLVINIKLSGKNDRKFVFQTPEKLSYLLEGIK